MFHFNLTLKIRTSGQDCRELQAALCQLGRPLHKLERYFRDVRHGGVLSSQQVCRAECTDIVNNEHTEIAFTLFADA
jgi:hypothetical protein